MVKDTSAERWDDKTYKYITTHSKRELHVTVKVTTVELMNTTLHDDEDDG